jgi:flagellar M-ring protein FliF
VDPQQLLTRLKALLGSLTTGQILSLGISFLVVAGVVGGSAWWMNRPSYALLFSDMDAESASQVVTRLKSEKVPYQIDAGGHAIRVPADRVDELRLDLTSQGLPSSGRVGFEIFDRTSFGSTEFLEQVNFRRALEGEIARTIATISEVSSARVHIAMGKESLFGESRPAKASVVLKLRGNRTLPASTVSGITNLVAASVDGLRPEAVVVLDTFGRPLSRPSEDPNDPLGGAQLERQQRLEHDMSSRVLALLEPVVGPDRVRVNVAVKLNPRTQEETEERWDPNEAVIRSKQTTADTAAGGSTAQSGVAGARANQPPPATNNKTAQAGTLPNVLGAVGPTTSRTAETTNYEISRTTRHVIQPSGDIARLSVAVILDDDQVATKGKDGKTAIKRVPRKAQEIQKIQQLVAAAVGLEPARGDQLTVENVSFDEPPVDDGTPPNVLVKYSPQIWQGSRILAIAGVGIIALLFVVRPLLMRTTTGAPVKAVAAGSGPAVMMPAGQAPRTVADLESEIEAQLDASISQRLEARRVPVLKRRVRDLTVKEPENVAKLLRAWITEPER